MVEGKGALYSTTPLLAISLLIMLFAVLQVKDKSNNAVICDKPTFDRIMKEVPTFKLISQSILIDRMKINGSLARVAIKHLEREGLIKPVVHHTAQVRLSDLLYATTASVLTLNLCHSSSTPVLSPPMPSKWISNPLFPLSLSLFSRLSDDQSSTHPCSLRVLVHSCTLFGQIRPYHAILGHRGTECEINKTKLSLLT